MLALKSSHDRRPLRFVPQHRRQHFLRKPPMTIAAGFRCENGIVICADREVSSESDKYEESKIFTLHPSNIDMNPQAVFAGSGWLDFVKMTVAKIRFNANSAANAYEVVEIIEKTILEVHRKHIRWYPSGGEKPHFNLVVGLRDAGGRLSLYNTSGTAVNEVPDYTSTGVGQTLSNYLSRVMTPHELPVEEKVLVAAQIIDQVKEERP